METIILTPKSLFDIERLVDCVAHYLSAAECPSWFSQQRVDFHLGDGQSNGWLVSEQKSETITRVTEAYMKRHGLFTPCGYRYISHGWNEAMFCVDGHYYFMSK